MPYIQGRLVSATEASRSSQKSAKGSTAKDEYVLSLAIVYKEYAKTSIDSVLQNDVRAKNNKVLEQSQAVKMDGVERPSRPPTPPSSGATTPKLPLNPWPERLWPYIPPPNFGTVDHEKIYRSSYPQDRNMGFLHRLQIRSMLVLVDTEPPPVYQMHMAKQNIKRHRVDIAPNKEGKVKTTFDSLCQALLVILDSSNHPLYIHCNQGRHRTGCMVACLRKIQRVPLSEILEEYNIYASPKARPGDIELIKAFEPEAVFEYARSQKYFSSTQSRLKRLDSSIADIDTLAQALQSGALEADLPGNESPGSNISTLSSTTSLTEEGMLEMAAYRAKAALQEAELQNVDTTHEHRRPTIVNGSGKGSIAQDFDMQDAQSDGQVDAGKAWSFDAVDDHGRERSHREHTI